MCVCIHTDECHPLFDTTWRILVSIRSTLVWFGSTGTTRVGTRGDCRTLDRSPLGTTGFFCKMGVSDCGGAWPGVYANGENCPGLPKDLELQALSQRLDSWPSYIWALVKALSCFQILPSFTVTYPWLKVFWNPWNILLVTFKGNFFLKCLEPSWVYSKISKSLSPNVLSR